MSIINELKNYLKEVIKAVGYDLEEITFIESSRKDLGDYQINDAIMYKSEYRNYPNFKFFRVGGQLVTDDKGKIHADWLT